MSRIDSFTPSALAAISSSLNGGGAIGSTRYVSTRTFEMLGTASLSNSRRLAESPVAISVRPVTLPPGMARLATSPVATGSPSAYMTIGIVFRCSCRRRGGYDDDIGAQSDALGGKRGKAISVAVGGQVIDVDVLPVHIT